MPICLDPRKRFTLHLSTDAEVPEAERAAFVCRPMTQSQFASLYSMAEQRSSGTLQEKAAFNYEVLKVCIREWRNMRTVDEDIAKLFGVDLRPGGSVELPFRADLLPEVLSLDEARELAEEALSRNVLSRADRKNSETQSQSNSVEAASTIPQPESVSN